MKKVQSASVTVANGNHLSYIAHFSYLEEFWAISLHLIQSPVLTSCLSTFSSVFATPRNAPGVLSLVRARHFSHFIYSLSCPFISLQPSWCISRSESLCCPPETNLTSCINYTQIKKREREREWCSNIFHIYQSPTILLLYSIQKLS